MSNNKDGKQVKNSNLDAMERIIKGYLDDEEKASIIEAIMQVSEHADCQPQVKKLLEGVSKAIEEFNGSVGDKSVADQLVASVVTMITFTLPLGLADFLSRKHAKMAKAFIARKTIEAGIGLPEMMSIAGELRRRKSNK